jgi:hypothetical protein
MKNETIYILIIIAVIFILCIQYNKKEDFKISDDLMCGISNDDKLWCAWEDIFKNPKWYQIKGDVKYVSLTDKNDLYGLDKVGNLYYRNDYEQDYKNPINWHIPNVPGQELKNFKQISSNKEILCGVDNNGKIYCYDRSNLIEPSWIEISAPEEKKFKNVTIRNNQLFAITEEDQIYYKEHYNNNEWKLLSNSLKQISVDDEVVCGIDADGQAYCYDNGRIFNPNWVKIEGKTFDNILVKNNVLIGVDKNKEIVMTKNYKDEKPVWIKIPGNGLKQIDIIKKDTWF